MIPLWLAVTAGLYGVTQWMDWYSGHVSLPRYCLEPRQQLLERLERIVTQPRPAQGESSTRPYVITAKLVFLIPRRAGEPDPDYLGRLSDHLETLCR